jgi:H+/Cl- antiporter ClcA
MIDAIVHNISVHALLWLKWTFAGMMVLGFLCGLAGALVTPLALTLCDKWLARWKARHGIAV